MLKKHQDLIKKADELIYHDILEYDKRFTSLYLSDSNIFKDWENHNDDEHFKVCEDIMKRERKHNSILWEAALITVMESAIVYFNDGYGFRYVGPNLQKCMERYKYIKKVISSKHYPTINLLTNASLKRINGNWYFRKYQEK